MGEFQQGCMTVSVAELAIQLREDMQIQYPRLSRKAGLSSSAKLEELRLKSGEGVTVIASRQKSACDQLLLALAEKHGINEIRPMVILGSSMSATNFVKELACMMAKVEREAPIYDGNLTRKASQRLVGALSRMSVNFIYYGRPQSIKVSELRMVMDPEINGNHCVCLLTDLRLLYREARTEMATATEKMRWLKEVSRDTKNPVIVIYLLDEKEMLPDFILSRRELRLMEEFANEGVDIHLLGQEGGELVFNRPKIPVVRV